MKKAKSYLFFGKTLFFPEKGILAIGDLHLGFEYQLQQSGLIIPERQVQEVKEELERIFEEIKEKGFKIKKIVFLGDIKHSFSYQWKERNYFREITEFLKKYADEKNIMLVKGNHDTIDYSFSDKLKDYFIKEDIAFTHGHVLFPEVFNDKVKTIVMGHLHPSILLSDRQNIKREKYKCFLIGKFRKKEVIILPSFLTTVEGTSVNNIENDYEDYFSIIPKKKLLNFEIYIVGDKETYDFGKISKFISK
jgi:putative SbcD/Mre11-related phosphoesterase